MTGAAEVTGRAAGNGWCVVREIQQPDVHADAGPGEDGVGIAGRGLSFLCILGSSRRPWSTG